MSLTCTRLSEVAVLRSREMKKTIAAGTLLITCVAVAQDLKPYKNMLVTLKTHENAFGAPTFSNWDNRKIHTANVAASVDGSTKVNGSTEWRDAFVVSSKQFQVKDIELDKRRNVVK